MAHKNNAIQSIYKRSWGQYFNSIFISFFKALVSVLFLTIPLWVKVLKAAQLKRSMNAYLAYFPHSQNVITAQKSSKSKDAYDKIIEKKCIGFMPCFRAVYESEGVFSEKPLFKNMNSLPTPRP